MPTVIELIERYEDALNAPGHDLDAAEADLSRALGSVIGPDHDSVCEPHASGCTEGVAHNGTIYAPGPSIPGAPAVIVLRRVRNAADFGA